MLMPFRLPVSSIRVVKDLKREVGSSFGEQHTIENILGDNLAHPSSYPGGYGASLWPDARAPRREFPHGARRLFEGQLYYLETMDMFHLIDRSSSPNLGDLVAAERLPTGQVVVEPFHGQPFFGVVRELKPYQLRRPEQWDRRVRGCRCND
jgi:hypothetical protein